MGNREYTLAERRRGEHFRTPDVVGCRGCEVGASVIRQLEKAKMRQAAEEAILAAKQAMLDEIAAHERTTLQLARAEALASAVASIDEEVDPKPDEQAASAGNMHASYKLRRGG